MSIKAMKQALEALEMPENAMSQIVREEAITALRTAIAEAEKQEPVIKGLEDAAYGLLAILERVGNGATVASVLTLLESKTHPPAAPVQKPVAWEHHAKKLTQWLHCMSHNESYFGEPAGLVKQVTGELNRLIGATPPAAQRQPLTEAMILALKRHEDGTSYTEGWNDALNLLADRAIEAAHGIR